MTMMIEINIYKYQWERSKTAQCTETQFLDDGGHHDGVVNGDNGGNFLRTIYFICWIFLSQG